MDCAYQTFKYHNTVHSGEGVPPTSPKMTVPDGQVGVPMDFKCVSEGYPPPDIVWTLFSDGQTIKTVSNTTQVVKVNQFLQANTIRCIKF